MNTRTAISTVILGLLLSVGIVSADIVDFKAHPSQGVDIPIGGGNVSWIELTVNSEGSYTIYYEVGSASKDIVNANISGPYDAKSGNPMSGLANTDLADCGSITFYANNSGTYWFKLYILAEEGATAGEEYAISLTALGFKPSLSIRGETVAGEIVPELPVAVLVGIGLVVVGVVIRNSYR